MTFLGNQFLKKFLASETRHWVFFFLFFFLKNVVYCRLMGIAARDTFADRGGQIGVWSAQVGTPIKKQTASARAGEGEDAAQSARWFLKHTRAQKRKWQIKVIPVIQQHWDHWCPRNRTLYVLPPRFFFLFLGSSKSRRLHRSLLIPTLNRCTTRS